MEEKKHIDRIFQEKLKDFEVSPTPQVWEAIEQQLVKKKKRRIVPLWYRLGAAAAILLLITTGVWYFNDSNDDFKEAPQTPVVIDKTKMNSLQNTQEEVVTDVNIDEQQATPVKEETKLPVFKNTTQYPTNTEVATTNNKEKVNKNNKTNIEKNTTIAQNEVNPSKAINNKNDDVKNLPVKTENKFTPKTIVKNDENAVANNEKATITKEDIAQAIEDNLENTEDKKVDKSSKWYVGPVVAPIQYNSFSNGSPISKSLASNSKKSNTTLAYGLKINYKLNDRLSIQSGVNSVDLSYSTRNVTAFVQSEQLSFSNNLTEQTNIEGANSIVVSDTKPNSQEFVAASRDAAVTLNGNLNQSISYVEVPLEAKYALTKTKLGVNLVGGVSTYILNDNSVSLKSFDGTKNLGQATNINNVNFSGNLGLDLDYKFSKKLFFNISPMFKYQMNTFSKDAGGFRPYFIGVYTGLNFRF